MSEKDKKDLLNKDLKGNTQDSDTSADSNNEEKKVDALSEEQLKEIAKKHGFSTQEQLDKVLSERLRKEREKLVADSEKRIAEAIASTEKKMRLSEEERQKELAEEEEQNRIARENDVAKRENRLTAREIFAEAGVPEDLVDYVVFIDADKTEEEATKFVVSYKKSVTAGIAAQLEDKPPKDVNANSKNEEEDDLDKSLLTQI